MMIKAKLLTETNISHRHIESSTLLSSSALLPFKYWLTRRKRLMTRHPRGGGRHDRCCSSN